MDPLRKHTLNADTLKGHKILIVDDAADNRFLMNHYLRSLGSETCVASNGLEALQKISMGHFDLIVMDLQMPVMDGYQAISELKSARHPVPVIAVTANYFSEARIRCHKAGFKTCLQKPIDRIRLLQEACDAILG
jgi:CheY-like chemotaxis protein